jgi:hypothetical protein
MNTSIKLSIEIENDRYGYGIEASFKVTEILFSDFNSLMDAEDIIGKVRQCLRAVKSFKMVSIYLTEGEQFSAYPKCLDSIRFVNNYGEVKTSYAVNNYFEHWHHILSPNKHIYKAISEIVFKANKLQAQRIAERVKVDDNQLPPPPSEIYLVI